MKRALRTLCCAVLAVALCFGTTPYALAQEAQEAPVENRCRAYILIEADTGQILAQHCADDVMPMASLTKMMTLLILFEAIDAGTVKLTDMVTISQEAADTGGSKAFLDAGASYSVDQLIRSIIVGSANDSSVAIAQMLAGSEEAFVQRMNERAQALGMTSTRFANATGLPAQAHDSTARDLAKLSAALVHHDMYFDYSTIWIDNFEHPSGRETMLANTNKLIRYGNGVDGIKTGFTNDAGFCLSASSMRDGMRLIAVVLGGSTSKDRFDQTSELLEWGFANYQIVKIPAPPEEVVLSAPIQGGKSASVDLIPQEEFVMLTQKTQQPQLEHTISLMESIQAPVAQGQTLGEWIITDAGREVARIPLYAAQMVEKATLSDYVKKILDFWYAPQKTDPPAQQDAA